ncbi:MAG TPA: DNA-binding protein [Nitrospiria bacterium]
MKKAVVIGVIVAVLAAAIGLWRADESSARGMNWAGSGGWGPGAPYHRIYDPATVETIAGEVVKVDHLTPVKGMSYGVHLILKSEKETVSVHLGPAWYIENQDTALGPNDRIEVRGSRVAFEGKPVIIAAEVRKGGQTLKLRDDAGVPVWSGWRGK